MPPADDEPREKIRQRSRNWMKYSGMAFQMTGTILAFVFGGIYLDRWLSTDPWGLIVLSLLGVFGGLYVALKDFI